MFSYILRRILYAIPILIMVNLITFTLFFVVNTPDDIARMNLGKKYITQTAITAWKQQHGYDVPLIYNAAATGLQAVTETLFFQKSIKLFVFDFGQSDAGRDIKQDVSERMWPSLAIAIPSLILGLIVNISISLLVVFFRNTYIYTFATIVTLMMFSISGLFYIIFGQYIFAKILQIVPISGYNNGIFAFKFVLLPILISVISGIGSGVRWYRSIFLEEIEKDYVRTARAKGLGDAIILFKHILKNGLIPILTGVVVIIPLLFMGSLILESFFGIPGLGSYTIDAIAQQDFAIVRCMVFLGSLLYIIGLMLTDISYVMVDPRVRIQK